MIFAAASGLLPAGMAVYVQRGPNGVGLETRYSVGLEGFTSQSKRSRHNCERPSWEAGSSGSIHSGQRACGLSDRTGLPNSPTCLNVSFAREYRSRTVGT